MSKIKKKQVLSPLLVLKGHTQSVNTITTDSTRCYSGSNDKTIRIWSLETGYCNSQLIGHEGSITSIRQYDGILYSCDSAGILKSWKTSNDELKLTFRGHTQRITTFFVDKHFGLFSASSDTSIISWDTNDGTIKQKFEGHDDYISQVHLEPKSETLYSTSFDKTLVSWDLITGQIEHKFVGHKDWILTMKYDKESNLIYTGSQDKTVRIWDPRTRECVQILNGHKYAIGRLEIYKKFLYTGSWDSTIGVFNLAKPKKNPLFLTGHRGKVRSLRIFEDLLYSGSNDGLIRVWSLKNHKCRAILKGHSSTVISIQIPNDQMTISCAEEKRILRWPSSAAIRERSEDNRKIIFQKEKQALEFSRNQDFELGSKFKEKEYVKIIIDDKEFKVKSHWNVLQACRKNKYEIPSLCYHPVLGPVGSCKCCVVEIESNTTGEFKSACACATEVWDDYENEKNDDDDNNYKSKNQSLGIYQELTSLDKLIEKTKKRFKDESNNAISVNISQCIDCTRCLRVCKGLQGLDIFGYKSTNSDKLISSINTRNTFLKDSECIACGQCTLYCPSGALQEIDQTKKFIKILEENKKLIVVALAPSARISMSELFGQEPGELTTGQCVHLLKLLGFHKIFDLQFFADLTIVEEANELVERLTDPKSKFPMFTSCCPSWINLVEKKFPEFIPNISTCRSPQQMFGSVIKNIYSKTVRKKPKDIFCVTIVPCTSKKQELLREEFINPETGVKDIDLSLTVREIGRLINRQKNIFSELTERSFDKPFSVSSSSGSLFSSSGGVMESAIKTAFSIYNNGTFKKTERTINLNTDQKKSKKLKKSKNGRVNGNGNGNGNGNENGNKDKNINHKSNKIINHKTKILNNIKLDESFSKPLRKNINIKETTVQINDKLTIKIAAVSGGKTIQKLLKQIKKGNYKAHFIEVMACPGGCIGGGGQPRSELNIVPIRKKSLYKREKTMKIKTAHDNPVIQTLYKNIFKTPNSKLSRKYLHTSYQKQIIKNNHKKTEKIKNKSKNRNKFLLNKKLTKIPRSKSDLEFTIKNSFLILYGSQTGTAEKAAIKISHYADSQKHKIRLMEMNEFGPPINLQLERLVVFVTSTFWDGNFPENASKFWKKLKSLPPNSLKNLKVAVFGLGSKQYTRFNNSAKRLNQKLIELGAKEVISIGLGDREDKNGYLTELIPWLELLGKVLKKYKFGRFK
ncbi:iron hydrogenase [Anaeramoeba flamelloides]|uniref:Iron hydrogenase n=1 Tax=Anaeramoeba flamelloides TaxID=1746091 RepID=A0ABQ8Z0G2_9EUKA|nr:iron hydrogenase [Anaeramoeba flamelloides]